MNDSHSQWHRGEEAMHRLLQVPYEDNPTVRGLPAAYGNWMAQSPLLALGTVDANDHVWTTVLGGTPGTARLIAAGTLGVSSPAHLVPAQPQVRSQWSSADPVLEALFSDAGDPPEGASDTEKRSVGGDIDLRGSVRHAGRGKLISGLVIDLEHRSRVKIAGRMLRGVILAEQPESKTTARVDQARVGVQMAVAVDETLGNCPKYLNKRAVRPHSASPRLISTSLPLSPEAVAIIDGADTFFISSRHGTESMDTNNRGGSPGFVRVFSNSEEEGVSLVYPEYSGNRLYQTLGNLKSDPAVGVTFPDFDTGDILYLTGRAEILVGEEAISLLPHSSMAVRIHVEGARLVKDGLSFRGRLLEPSPYNPPVRKLAREMGPSAVLSAERDEIGKSMDRLRASLVRKHSITPTITRYTFRLSLDEKISHPRPRAEPQPWRAGQHVTLNFSAQLDHGWSHMRDHDPASLNDDFVRSFTISSEPATFRLQQTPSTQQPNGLNDNEFDITVRTHGPVTRLLASWIPGSNLTVDVLGFGGEDDDRYADRAQRVDADHIVAVASGIGITPFMAQAQPAWESGLQVTLLWSLRAQDLPLAVDVIGRLGGLGTHTTLFVTGRVEAAQEADLLELTRLGTQIHYRRLDKSDVLGVGEPGRRQFYVCAVPTMRKSLLEWVAGEYVRSEGFDY